jgi:DNA-binding NarL/FixJ family response regulator
MEAPLPIRVVILYVHPLLGEGLAKLLAAEPGIAASAISTDDTLCAAAALSSRPDAVIIEQRVRASSPTLPGNVTAPLVLFVDIAGAGGARQSTDAALADGRSDRHGTSPVTDDLERVVRAVRDLKRTRLALVSA